MSVPWANGTGGSKRRDSKQGRAFLYGDMGGVFEAVPYPEHTDATERTDGQRGREGLL